jgi:hypothetical protein
MFIYFYIYLFIYIFILVLNFLGGRRNIGLIYAVQPDTQYSYIIEFIPKLVRSTVLMVANGCVEEGEEVN